MPAIKPDGDSDGDGDMSGGETERSGASSHHDRDSSAEEAEEADDIRSDSDSSSEMDEAECERRRNECLENLEGHRITLGANELTVQSPIPALLSSFAQTCKDWTSPPTSPRRQALAPQGSSWTHFSGW